MKDSTMKMAVAHLENQFELILDSYCRHTESVNVAGAEARSAEAEDYLEAIGVLKYTMDLAEKESPK